MARVLVVEDNEELREGLCDVLQAVGHDVVPAEHGRRALEVLRVDAAFDLVLLDLLMPVMTGEEFLRARALEPRVRAVPVIVLSAWADRLADEDVIAAFRKPVDLEALLQVIARCGARRRAGAVASS